MGTLCEAITVYSLKTFFSFFSLPEDSIGNEKNESNENLEYNEKSEGPSRVPRLFVCGFQNLIFHT